MYLFFMNILFFIIYIVNVLTSTVTRGGKLFLLGAPLPVKSGLVLGSPSRLLSATSFRKPLGSKCWRGEGEEVREGRVRCG